MIWDNCHESQLPPFTIDLNEGLQEWVAVEEQQFFATPKSQPSSSSSSSLSSPTFFFSDRDYGDYCHNNQLSHHSQHHEDQAKISAPGSCDEMKNNIAGINQNRSIKNQMDTSVKWMSSKTRMKKKMMNPTSDHRNTKEYYYMYDDHKQTSASSEVDNCSNTTIRVCSDCNTTKTPLWRSGPRGPKSLCNACGIRHRKARRAAMAAAAAAAASAVAKITTVPAASKSKFPCKNKKSSGGTCVAQLKKNCKLVDSSELSAEITGDNTSNNNNNNNNKDKLCFEDLRAILSKNSAVFPQDEKEGAILLMALSYGLIQGN